MPRGCYSRLAQMHQEYFRAQPGSRAKATYSTRTKHTTKNACTLACKLRYSRHAPVQHHARVQSRAPRRKRALDKDKGAKYKKDGQGPLLKTCTSTSRMHLCKAGRCGKSGHLPPRSYRSQPCRHKDRIISPSNCATSNHRIPSCCQRRLFSMCQIASNRRSDALPTSPGIQLGPGAGRSVCFVACRHLMHGDERSCPWGPSEGASSHHGAPERGYR